MIRFLRYTAALLAVMILCAIAPVFDYSALAESNGMIRVKITRLGSPTSVSFTTGCDYYVDGDLAVKIPSGSKVTVNVSGANLTLICGSYSLNMGDDFTINRRYSGVSGVKFTAPALSNVYCGDFRFMLESGKITTIMTIYVEDYLYGVVGYEMSNSYPVEALKAQAIAARNYVLRAKSNRSKRAYDVVDTSSDQVFKGYNPSYTRVIQAVDETRGTVLTYDGKLAYCYYSGSNGGQTESTKNAWGSSVPYSVVKDDRFDLEGGKKCNSVTLKKDQSGESMNPAMHAALVDGMTDELEEYGLSTDPADVRIERIVDIEPHDPKYPEPSILYRKLRFTVEASSVNSDGERISGTVSVDIPTYGGIEDWYSLSINSSSNETVSVDETDTAFVISFRRWGHGIGMSQHGARVMAQDYTMDCDDILDFYYPGTELKQLNLSDTTGSGLTQSGDSSPLEKPLEPKPTEEPDETEAPDAAEKPVMQAQVKLSNSSGKLNMRSGAGTSFGVATRLSHGDIVDVYAIEGDWVAIGFEGQRGYVMKKYLVKYSADAEQPTPAPTEQPEDTETPVMQARVKLSSGSGTLNMRRGPSTSTSVVTRLRHGALVDVYAIEGDWVRIGAGSARGYVMKKYLVKEESGTAAQPTVPPGPGNTQEPDKTPGADDGAERVYAKVTLSSGSSRLKVRKGPGTSYGVAGYLNRGDVVEVTALSGSWARIETASGATGYVHKAYLKRVYPDGAPAATPAPDSTAAPVVETITAVATESTFVYTEPDTSSPAIAGLDEGDTVTVTAYNNTWARVTIDGKEGYVPVKHLKRAK